MASSSRSINHHDRFLKCIDEESGPKGGAIEEIEGEEEEEEEDLLQLKLGLGSAATLCRNTVLGNDNGESNPVVHPRSGLLGLGLGLKLWPKEQEEGSSEMVVGVEEVARRFIGRLPPWQMDSQDWYKPITTSSLAHHYSHHTDPHHSGLWFTLHSSTNHTSNLGFFNITFQFLSMSKREALPQVPKAYIRVKNEEMTIFMVKKYLVTKLGLFNENEVEILCMGQRLLDAQSLKLVRDSIWIPALIHPLNSAASKSLADSCGGRGIMNTTPNLMPLLYRKYLISNHSNCL